MSERNFLRYRERVVSDWPDSERKAELLASIRKQIYSLRMGGFSVCVAS